MPPYSAIQSLLLQMRISSPVAQRLDPFSLCACTALSFVDGCNRSGRAGWVPSSIETELVGMFHLVYYHFTCFGHGSCPSSGVVYKTVEAATSVCQCV